VVRHFSFLCRMTLKSLTFYWKKSHLNRSQWEIGGVISEVKEVFFINFEINFLIHSCKTQTSIKVIIDVTEILLSLEFFEYYFIDCFLYRESSLQNKEVLWKYYFHTHSTLLYRNITFNFFLILNLFFSLFFFSNRTVIVFFTHITFSQKFANVDWSMFIFAIASTEDIDLFVFFLLNNNFIS